MPNYTYNRDIPNEPNAPADDQPNMKVNNNSIQDFLAVDHFGFNNNDGGWHEQVTMPEASTAPTTAANQGALYTKDVSGTTQLFYRRESDGDEYQLTTSNTPSAANSGYTFLPGNILMQWGQNNANAKGTTTINFPTSFSGAPYSIVANMRRNNDNVDTIYISTALPTASNFVVYNTSSSVRPFYWMAIGPA